MVDMYIITKRLNKLDNKSILAKKELQQAIKTKINIETKLKNNQYRITQENLKKTIADYETEAAQKKSNNITENADSVFGKLQTISKLRRKYKKK